MARPVCHLFIPASLEQAFAFVQGQLNDLGLSFVNPWNSKITTWTEDGTQLEVVSRDILHDVVSKELRSVQFWINSSEDVFVSWKECASGCVFSLYLDGLDLSWVTALTAKLSGALLLEFGLVTTVERRSISNSNKDRE
jgi:hypothetical protein